MGFLRHKPDLLKSLELQNFPTAFGEEADVNQQEKSFIRGIQNEQRKDVFSSKGR